MGLFSKVKLTKKRIIILGIIIYLIIGIKYSFPVVPLYEQRKYIPLFAPERFLKIFFIKIYDFDSFVIGNHIIETDFGKINLYNFAKIKAIDNKINGFDYFNLNIGEINNKTFRSELAIHNLKYEGNELPKNISIYFDYGKIKKIDIDSELIISGKLLYIKSIEFKTQNNSLDKDIRIENPDVLITLDKTPELIILSDSTIIQTNNKTIFLFKNNETWTLVDSLVGILYVTFPNENQSRRYSSIEFMKDWGKYLIGEIY